MIKRAIILILILAGLYWITSSFKDGENTDIQKDAEKKVEETMDNDDEEKTDSSDKEVNEEEGASKESNEEDDKISEEATETKTEATKNETVTTKPPVVVTPEVKTTVNTTPTVTVPAVVTKPVTVEPTTPTVPDRTTYVKVYMYEWGVDVSSKEIPTGNVAFTVVNSGRFSHDFNISGLKNFGKVSPRQTVTFSAKIPTGSYDIFSGRRDDLESGMTEGITVVR